MWPKMRKTLELITENWYNNIVNRKPVSRQQIELLGEYLSDIEDLLLNIEYISDNPALEPCHDNSGCWRYDDHV